MVIDTPGLVTTLATLLSAAIVWGVKRIFVQRLDEIGEKLEELRATVNAMSLQTAKDHSEVRERIARIETLTERA